MEHVPIVVKIPFSEGKEDFSTSVLPSWTIFQLKKHLEDSLPRKPKAETQKLIFAGRILTDDHLVKDCIKSAPKGSPPVLHLVHGRPVEEIQSEPTAENEGLRQRHVQPPQETPVNSFQNVPPSQWMPYQYGFGYNDQMMQEYHNYMQGYMYGMSQGGMPGMMPFPYQFNPAAFPYQQYPMTGAGMPANPQAPFQPNRPPAVAVVRIHRGHAPAAQEMPEEADNGAGRDVLDWMYIALRLMLFILVICVYSSTARFFSAFTMFAIVLLFNTVRDFRRWRERHVRHQQQQQPVPAPNPPAADAAVPANDASQAQNTETPNQPAQQGFLSGCVSFVMGLVASLVPDNNIAHMAAN